MATPQNEEKSLQQASPSAQSSGSRPSLLPAFEPLSSSPALPRAKCAKRKYGDRNADFKHYPTPIPTSSTGILPSSPPARPGLNRNVSAISTLEERAPLGAVPAVNVPLSGEPVCIGRSANSSDYQLSANRLISRVHIRALYLAPSSEHPYGEILIECLGWNGAKVHCKNEIYQLAKGDSFASDRPEAQIIIDVLETRVLVAWPQRDGGRERSSTGWEEEEESLIRNVAENAAEPEIFASSPPLMPGRLQSPVSPSPLRLRNSTEAATFSALDVPDIDAADGIQVYEDQDAAEDQQQYPSHQQDMLQQSSNTLLERSPIQLSKSNLSLDFDEHSDSNEENDPIVHSFYTSGENLLSRFESIKSDSTPAPRRDRSHLKARSSPNSPQQGTSFASSRKVQISPIKNHVINQLAYSRIHSMPLSTIFNNLPSEFKNDALSVNIRTDNKLTGEELKSILDATPCVGEINREGKDAAGKQLENEFYYVPEMDTDDMRRNAVVDGLGKPGLRAVRKQHKVSYSVLQRQCASTLMLMGMLLVAILLEASSILRILETNHSKAISLFVPHPERLPPFPTFFQCMYISLHSASRRYHVGRCFHQHLRCTGVGLFNGTLRAVKVVGSWGSAWSWSSVAVFLFEIRVYVLVRWVASGRYRNLTLTEDVE